MLSPEDRHTLYNPENFKRVSSQTRTDIIGMIDYDIDGLAKEEGGKFTYEELCNGLHYLLATNKDLHAYIEQNKSQISSSESDPFIIPSRALRDLEGLGNCCLDCGSPEICIVFGVLVMILWVFVFTYENIRDMLKSEEPSVVKMAKVIANLIVFIGVIAPVWFFMPTIYVVGLSSAFAVFCGVVAAALFSYASKTILCFPPKQKNLDELLKPSDELLEELGVIKKMLKENYTRKGDDKAACMEFLKTVVRLHINAISKPENVKSPSSLGGYGSFHKSVITEQPANDAKQNTEDTPTCSASK